MHLFWTGFGCLTIGVTIGALIENYRARVNWGFPLGKEWKPPHQS